MTNEAGPSTTTDVKEAVTAIDGPPKFQPLSTFYLATLPENMRRDTYHQVLAAVNEGQLPGILHRGNKITLPMPEPYARNRAKPLDEVLLKNTSDLQEHLDRLAETVVSRQVVQNGGKGMSVDDLLSMGDALDFDAMIVSAQERRRRTKKAAVVRPAKAPKRRR